MKQPRIHFDIQRLIHVKRHYTEDGEQLFFISRKVTHRGNGLTLKQERFWTDTRHTFLTEGCNTDGFMMKNNCGLFP